MAVCRVHSVRDCATETWPRYAVGTSVEVFVPRASFERTLGMARRRDLDRQLAVDLPRSHVVRSSDGTRLLRVADVHSATRYARFCTQAVCAPVLEWFMRADLLAWEVPGGGHPLRVVVFGDGGLLARKRLMLATSGMVEVAVYVSDGAVVVSSQPCAPRTHACVAAPVVREDDRGRDEKGVHQRRREAREPG